MAVEWRMGMKVMITGLKAKPELNGVCGFIQAETVEKKGKPWTKGRLAVMTPGHGKLSVKGINLIEVPDEISMAANAAVEWAQRKDKLFVTVKVMDSIDTKIDITDTSLSVSGKCGRDKKVFAVKLVFHADIEPAKCMQLAKDKHRFLFFTLIKEQEAEWPSLLQDKGRQAWLKVDFNKWKDEDEPHKPDAYHQDHMEGMQKHMSGLATMVPGAPGYDEYQARQNTGPPAAELGALIKAIVKGCGATGEAVRQNIIGMHPRLRVLLTETVPPNAAIKIEGAGTDWFNGFYRREGETGGVAPGQGPLPVPPLPRFARIGPDGELLPHNNNPVAIQFRMSAVNPNPMMMMKQPLPGAMWCLMATDKPPREEIAHLSHGKIIYSNEKAGLCYPPPEDGWDVDTAFVVKGADGRLPPPIGVPPFPKLVMLHIEEHQPGELPKGRR